MSFKSLFKRSSKKTAPSSNKGSSTGSGGASNSVVQDSIKSSSESSEFPMLDAVKAQQEPKARGGGLKALLHKAFKTKTWKQQQAEEAEAKRALEVRIDDEISGLGPEDLLGDLRPFTFASLKQQCMPELISLIEELEGSYDPKEIWETYFIPGSAKEINLGKKERAQFQAYADAGRYDAMDFLPVRDVLFNLAMYDARAVLYDTPEVREYVAAKLGPAPSIKVESTDGIDGEVEGGSSGNGSETDTKKPKSKLGGLSLAFHRAFKRKQQ